MKISGINTKNPFATKKDAMTSINMIICVIFIAAAFPYLAAKTPEKKKLSLSKSSI